MLLGYARVSTDDQETHLQIDALKAAGCERVYQEKASGAKADRPELMRLLDNARKGDVVIVWKLDRLGRSLLHLIETVNLLHARGVQLKSLNENLIDTTSPSGKFLFGIFGLMAEFERDMLRQSTNAGLAAARRRGRVGGRPKEHRRRRSQEGARDADLGLGVRYSRGRASRLRTRSGLTVPFTEVGRIGRAGFLLRFFMAWLSLTVPSRDIYGTVPYLINCRGPLALSTPMQSR